MIIIIIAKKTASLSVRNSEEKGRRAYTTTPRFHRCTVAVDIGAMSQPFSGELDREGDSPVEGAERGRGGVEARFGDGALEILIGSCETWEFLDAGRDEHGEADLCEIGVSGPAVMLFRPCVEMG